jgi:hypothetical protein
MAETHQKLFDYADIAWSEEDNCYEYVHSDMALRIMAKTLMMKQQSCEIPRQKTEIERNLGHVVFELAYRTNTLREYIGYQAEATLLEQRPSPAPEQLPTQPAA